MRLPLRRSRHPLHPKALADRARSLLGGRDTSSLGGLKPKTARRAVGLTLILVVLSALLITKMSRGAAHHDFQTA